MKDWKSVSIKGIVNIEKLVAEFHLFDVGITPYGKVKVKIFEKRNGTFEGVINLRLKSLLDGQPEGMIGIGNTVTDALEDTVEHFLNSIRERNNLSEDDYEYIDPDDF